MLIEYLKAFVFGIVEGITEWLPISSTGHLILLEELIALRIADGELAVRYRALFDVVIQLGAILAVIALYRKKLISPGKASRSLYQKLVLATLPSALIGLCADALCERYLSTDLGALLFRPYIVASCLVAYGFLFILIERLSSQSNITPSTDEISCKRAFAIGCFQSLALIPGTSRSGATILGARMLGISRASATEFSFFAAIPVIFGASAFEILDFCKFTADTQTKLSSEMLSLLLFAGAVAFFVSLICIKFLTEFVRRHTFICFGIYRIILGIAVFIFIDH